MSLTIFALSLLLTLLLTLLSLLLLGVPVVREGRFVVGLGLSEALLVDFYNAIGQQLYVI